MNVNNAIKWLEEQGKNILNVTEKFSLINSYSYNSSGLESFSKLVQNTFSKTCTLSKLKIPIHKIDHHLSTKTSHYAPLLYCKIRPHTKDRLFLGGHLDTVYPPSVSFPISKDTTHLYGPGVADMKGGLAVMLFALSAFEKFIPKKAIGFNIILNPDEEIGSVSSQFHIEKFAIDCRAGLIFEPESPNGMVKQRGGSITIAVSIYGKSAHVGRNFYDGIHAGYIGSDFICQLRRCINTSTIINISNIQCPGPANQVPDLCTFKINVRYSLESDLRKFLIHLKELSLDFYKQFSAKILSKTISHRLPKPLSYTEKNLQNKLNLVNTEFKMSKLNWIATKGVCDSSFLSQLGIPCIDTMGPIGSSLHSPNETLQISSLVSKAKLTFGLFNKFNNIYIKD